MKIPIRIGHSHEVQNQHKDVDRNCVVLLLYLTYYYFFFFLFFSFFFSFFFTIWIYWYIKMSSEKSNGFSYIARLLELLSLVVSINPFNIQ